jgi:hypothetical protein
VIFPSDIFFKINTPSDPDGPDMIQNMSENRIQIASGLYRMQMEPKDEKNAALLLRCQQNVFDFTGRQ